MRAKLTMTGVMLGLCGLAQAQDLISTYRDAQGYDAQFAAARAQFVAAQERVPLSRAGLLPNASLSANTTWNDVEGLVSGPQKYNSNGYSINLTQPLLHWDRKIGLDQAHLQTKQALWRLEVARQDLMLRVSQAYFDILLAEDSLAALLTQRAANEEQLELARKGLDVGTATITDLHDAQARFDLVKAQEIAARNDLAAKRQAMRRLTGKVPASVDRLRDGVALSTPTPNDMDKWAETAENEAMIVLAQRTAAEIVRLETKKARAEHYPTLDVQVSRTNSSSGSYTTIGSDITNDSIGLQFNLPIFSGGATVAHQREVSALRDKAESELDDARRNSALNARQAFLDVTSGLAQVQALEQARASSRTALEANRMGFEVGVRINIDVLNAQQQLAVTERDLAKARYQTLLALMRLKAASGSLVEGDIEQINALLAK